MHSRFDPEREAERFIANACSTIHPSMPLGSILVIGPCCGYITKALRDKYPRTRIVALQASRQFSELEAYTADATFYADDAAVTMSSIYGALGDDADFGVMKVAWGPSLDLFSCKLLEGIDALVTRANSSATTLAHWGKRWIRNAFGNVTRTRFAVSIETGCKASALVLCPGSSLEAFIKAWRRECLERCLVIAVSSALPSLVSAGIRPHIVVTSDPGAHSRLHLYSLAAYQIPLAHPITSYPIQCGASLQIRHGTSLDSYFSQGWEPYVDLPENGTAAGLALLLASKAVSGPIGVVGLDMASLDVMSHSAPHGFDDLKRKNDRRLSPRHSIDWIETSTERPIGGGWKVSSQFSTYAAWFSHYASSQTGRTIVRVAPSAVPIDGMIAMGANDGLDMLLSVNGSAPEIDTRVEHRSNEEYAKGCARSMEKDAEEWINGRDTKKGFDIVKMLSLRMARKIQYGGSSQDRIAATAMVRAFFADIHARLG
jgi:hypothetical protein